MDPAAMLEMQVQQESTSRSRICTVIAVMACIVMGCFLLLGFSLKRNDELVAILDQYREYLNQQSVQSPPVAAAVPQAAAKEPAHVKRTVHRANSTRPDEVQVVYLNAPSATPAQTRRRTKPPVKATPLNLPASLNLSNAPNVQQQQLVNESALALMDNASAAVPVAGLAHRAEASENASASLVAIDHADAAAIPSTGIGTWYSERDLPDAAEPEVDPTAHQAWSPHSNSVATNHTLRLKSELPRLVDNRSTPRSGEFDRDVSSSYNEEEVENTLVADATRVDSNTSALLAVTTAASNTSVTSLNSTWS